MSTEDKDTLLDLSVLTNDDSGELDPAVLAQFKAYEKAIATLTAQVKTLAQRIDNQNSTEQSGLPTSTAADTSTSTGSSIASNVSSTGSTLTTQCHIQSTCSSCTSAHWPGASNTQAFNPQAQAFFPHSHSLPPKLEPGSTEECKTPIGPLHQGAPAPSAPNLGDLHNSSEMHSAHNNFVASGHPLTESILFSRTCPPFGSMILNSGSTWSTHCGEMPLLSPLRARQSAQCAERSVHCHSILLMKTSDQVVRTKGLWHRNQLIGAIESIDNKEQSIRGAAKKYGVPESSIRRRMKPSTSLREGSFFIFDFTKILRCPYFNHGNKEVGLDDKFIYVLINIIIDDICCKARAVDQQPSLRSGRKCRRALPCNLRKTLSSKKPLFLFNEKTQFKTRIGRGLAFKGHAARICPSRSTCQVCNATNHTRVLHEGGPKRGAARDGGEPPEKVTRMSLVTQRDNGATNPAAGTVNDLPSRLTVLPTALVRISGPPSSRCDLFSTTVRRCHSSRIHSPSSCRCRSEKSILISPSSVGESPKDHNDASPSTYTYRVSGHPSLSRPAVSVISASRRQHNDCHSKRSPPKCEAFWPTRTSTSLDPWICSLVPTCCPRLDWDDELPENAIREWRTIREGLDRLTEVSIPRWTQSTPTSTDAQIHVFADASRRAMASVAYLRRQQNRAHLHLLIARTKLASIKSLKDDPRKQSRMTIPWLELRAAFLAVRLLYAICSELSIRIEDCVAWSDSRIVLHWIRSAEPTGNSILPPSRHKLHRGPTPEVLAPITCAELHVAFQTCVRRSQYQSFERELTILQANLPVLVRSPLASVDPFICFYGLLRVGGWLYHSQLSFNKKHPLIVDGSNAFASLIISWAHLQALHGGFRATYVQVLQRVWLINRKRAISRHIHHCVTCVAAGSRAMSQIMAPLPPERITPCRAFARTRLDYAGPFQVWASRGRGVHATKSWVAVFVCLTTKSVHLELAGDLSTASLLYALTRFSGRRGRSSELWSDNATHFHRADLEIRNALNNERLNWTTISDSLAEDKIKWSFIPPSAPHFGGLWKAAVKSLKAHLKRTLGPRRVTFEEKSTLLVSIEAVLNSRPLCPVTNDSDDLHVLTPRHFLVGTSLLTIPEQDVNVDGLDHLHHWQLIQGLQAVFSKKWSREYLNTLQQRTKWLRQRESIAVGDIVLLMDPSLLRLTGRWPLGRVIK
ncbi:unnamed protein product, partial [Trichogramma brassicae]